MAHTVQTIGSDREHSPASEASSNPPRTPVSPTFVGLPRGSSGLTHLAGDQNGQQSTAAAAPKRKSSRRANTAERRATHNAVERQRRETLNGRFLDLANLLPNLTQIRRPSKSSIVNSSIAHMHASRRHRQLASREVRALKTETDALRREINEWRDRAGLPRVDEPDRSEGFAMVLSGELEVLAAVPDEDGEVGEYVEQEGEAMNLGGDDFSASEPMATPIVPSSAFSMDEEEETFAHSLPQLSASASSRSSSDHGHPRPLSMNEISPLSRDGPASREMMMLAREQREQVLARDSMMAREQALREAVMREREREYNQQAFAHREFHNHRDPLIAHPSNNVAFGDPAMPSMYDASMYGGNGGGGGIHPGHEMDKFYNHHLHSLSTAQMAQFAHQQRMYTHPSSAHGISPSGGVSPPNSYNSNNNNSEFSSFMHRQRREQELLARARNQLLSPREQQVLREYQEREDRELRERERDGEEPLSRRRDRSSSLSNSHGHGSPLSYNSPDGSHNNGGMDSFARPGLSINTSWRDDVKTEISGKDVLLKSPSGMRI